MYHGDIRLGDTIDIRFTTRRFSTGAPHALASGAVACFAGNGTSGITSGVTLSADLGSITGRNNVRIVASSGNGFATATNYSVELTAGTVDSVSVAGEVIGSFSIENRSALMPTTAARTLDVSVGGEAGIDWANIGSPTTAQNLSATNIDVDQVVASVSGAVGSVTGAVGSVTGNVGGNVVGSIGSVAAGGITAGSFAAGAIDAAAIAADAIGASELAADAVSEIAAAVWDLDATTHQTQGTFGQAIGDPAADTNTIYKAVVTDATGATVGVDVVDLKTQIGVAGAGLTAIDLPDQTMNITGNITGNLSGSVGSVTGAVGSVTGAVGSVTGNVGGNVTGSVGSLAAQAKTDVNAEVVDALNVDTYAEIGQEAPAATQTMRKMLGYLYKAWRNKSDQTATTYQLYADDAATVDQKSTVSDDGVTFTSGEKATGP